jgi:DNA-binding response OmpR family regulator
VIAQETIHPGFTLHPEHLQVMKNARHHIEVIARSPLTVLIADDDLRFSDNLRRFLTQEAGIEVTGVAWTFLGAIRLARDEQPDAVVLDAGLPDGDVAVTTALLRQLENPPEVLLVSAEPADDRVALALASGASGYLPKELCIPEMRTALQSVARRRQARRTAAEGGEVTQGSVELQRR